MSHCRYKNQMYYLLFCIFGIQLCEKGLTITIVSAQAENKRQTTCLSDETTTGGSCDAGKFLENKSYDSEEKTKEEDTTTTSRKTLDNTNIHHNECKDNSEHCVYWAENGECNNNPNYMSQNCRLSCGTCPDPSDTKPDDLARGTDFGVAQVGIDYGNEDALLMQENIIQARKYLEKPRNTLDPKLFALCTNTHEQCTQWAIQGECDKHPNYMKRNCAPACNSCEYLDTEKRCKFDPDEASLTNVWGPGDLNKMFVKLTSEPYLSKYSVQTLSSPEMTGGPWVIVMENVVSEYEAERLIELGGKSGYERSTGVGKVKADGSFENAIVTQRTSTNTWCKDECYNDDVAQTIVQRLSNITDIPETNSEYLQLLRYEEGQFYNVHHDFIAAHMTRRPGGRIITAYMYLNDVLGGGGTEFPELNLTVTPKRGRMIVWPSVFDDEPTKEDPRTSHSALNVTEGLKYGANAWFHIRDYKSAYAVDCD